MWTSHALGALVLAGVAACGPTVERAPFSSRPDSLLAGDLLGPYDGMVLDAETDRPLSGALIAGSWAFESGVGLTGPKGAHEVVTETGMDGRFRIAALKAQPQPAAARVRRFTLIVVHKGYVGWRSDRIFPSGLARRDFSQRGSRIRLEKWHPGFLHHRHLVFLGGGPAVRAAVAGEIASAAVELEGTAAKPGAEKTGDPAVASGTLPLDVGALLSEAEIKGVTGYAGPFDVGKLADLPTTEFYDSRHFKARGKTEAFDVGLRVWRLGPAGSEAQYRKLLAELPDAQSKDEIGDASLRAARDRVLGLAFFVRERGITVSVTCGVQQCADPAMILRIGKLVESRLSDLPVGEGSAATP